MLVQCTSIEEYRVVKRLHVWKDSRQLPSCSEYPSTSGASLSPCILDFPLSAFPALSTPKLGSCLWKRTFSPSLIGSNRAYALSLPNIRSLVVCCIKGTFAIERSFGHASKLSCYFFLILRLDFSLTKKLFS